MPAKFAKKVFGKSTSTKVEENSAGEDTTSSSADPFTENTVADVDLFSTTTKQDSADAPIQQQQSLSSLNESSSIIRNNQDQQQQTTTTSATAKFFDDNDDDEHVLKLDDVTSNNTKNTHQNQSQATGATTNSSSSPRNVSSSSKEEKSLTQMFLEQKLHGGGAHQQQQQQHHQEEAPLQQQHHHHQENSGNELPPHQHHHHHHQHQHHHAHNAVPIFAAPPPISQLQQQQQAPLFSSSSIAPANIIPPHIQEQLDQKFETLPPQPQPPHRLVTQLKESLFSSSSTSTSSSSKDELWRRLQGLSVDPHPDEQNFASPVFNLEQLKKKIHLGSSSSCSDNSLIDALFETVEKCLGGATTTNKNSLLPPLLQHCAPQVLQGSSFSSITASSGNGKALLTFLTICLAAITKPKAMMDENNNEFCAALVVCPSQEIELEEVENFERIMRRAPKILSDLIRAETSQEAFHSSNEDDDDQQQQRRTTKTKTQKAVVLFVDASREFCPLTSHPATQHHQRRQSTKTIEQIMHHEDKIAKKLSGVKCVVFAAAEKFSFTPFLSADPKNPEVMMRIPKVLEPSSSGSNNSIAIAVSRPPRFDQQWIILASENERCQKFITALEKSLFESNNKDLKPLNPNVNEGEENSENKTPPKLFPCFNFQSNNNTSSTTTSFETLNRWSKIAHTTEFVPMVSVYDTTSPAAKREFALLLQIIQRTPPPIVIMVWSSKTCSKLVNDLRKVFPSSSSNIFITEDPLDFRPHSNKSSSSSSMPWILVTNDTKVRGYSDILPKFNHLINLEIPLLNKPEIFADMMTMRADMLGNPILFPREKRQPLVTTVLNASRQTIANLVSFSDFLKNMRLPVPPMLVMVVNRSRLAPGNNFNNNERGVRRFRERQGAYMSNGGGTNGIQLNIGNGNNNNNDYDDEDDEMMRAFDAL